MGMRSKKMIQHTVTVNLSDRSYPIFIGGGTVSETSLFEPHIKGRNCFLVTDSNVAPLYAEKVREALNKAGAAKVSEYVFTAGEESKNIQTIDAICRSAAQAGLDRRSIMVALGGGVAGDMTGFSAAIYMRGIEFIQIPTTLLAMVDSSVGGKTGVDIPEGKNLIGAFHQPKAVIIDTDFLNTLPDCQFLCGLAEIIKTAAILDAEFFASLESNISRIQQRDADFSAAMVKRCCELKADVVSKDEREGSLRAILNYGHTYGHAIESSYQYKLLHGEAVAVGMCLAAELAVSLGIMSREDAERQRKLISAVKLPTEIKYDTETVFQGMFKDKKALDGVLRFVFTPVIGKAEIRKVESSAVRSILESRNA